MKSVDINAKVCYYIITGREEKPLKANKNLGG